jgi:hypothetical protein
MQRTATHHDARAIGHSRMGWCHTREIRWPSRASISHHRGLFRQRNSKPAVGRPNIALSPLELCWLPPVQLTILRRGE